MEYRETSLKMHEQWQGKIQVVAETITKTREDLSIVYTPGVAEPCKEIYRNKADVYRYTMKRNFVAVVTDGTAVLGLGDIGPEAAMPVMEGKAVLFKAFGNVDAVPICLDTKDTDEIVKTVKNLAPTFGGINLEDISAPRCFEIEQRLKDCLDIPVFHDDQHGTAVVVLAAIINSLKLVDKRTDDCKVVINGAGAAGIAVGKLLYQYGFRNIIFCDSKGIINKKNANNFAKKEVAQFLAVHEIQGRLEDALVSADIFIGVSAPGCLTKEMIRNMNSNAIVFAMANPVPEIMPKDALDAGARIVGTGRSDFPNQINNVLAFPGIFRGALDAGASSITEKMKLAAARAIADIVTDEELKEDYIIPDALDKRVPEVVAKAVFECADR
jgi:malate dehydrogenase (oxaloacetate-decarboxylating)